MKHIELSMEELDKIVVGAAKGIAEKEQVNLLVYIARAGFPVAFYMSKVFRCRLLGVSARRGGNQLKSVAGRVLVYTPRFFRDFLRNIELKSRIRKRHQDRHVEFHRSLQELDRRAEYSILIVDDAVDTGNSMRQVIEKVTETFPNATITTYAINVFEESKAQVAVDYSTFRDFIIRTPMSKDSKEYKMFCEMYQRETSNEYL